MIQTIPDHVKRGLNNVLPINSLFNSKSGLRVRSADILIMIVEEELNGRLIFRRISRNTIKPDLRMYSQPRRIKFPNNESWKLIMKTYRESSQEKEIVFRDGEMIPSSDLYIAIIGDPSSLSSPPSDKKFQNYWIIPSTSRLVLASNRKSNRFRILIGEEFRLGLDLEHKKTQDEASLKGRITTATSENIVANQPCKVEIPNVKGGLPMSENGELKVPQLGRKMKPCPGCGVSISKEALRHPKKSGKEIVGCGWREKKENLPPYSDALGEIVIANHGLGLTGDTPRNMIGWWEDELGYTNPYSISQRKLAETEQKLQEAEKRDSERELALQEALKTIKTLQAALGNK